MSYKLIKLNNILKCSKRIGEDSENEIIIIFWLKFGKRNNLT